MRREPEARVEEKRRHDTIVLLHRAERIPELVEAPPAPPGPRGSCETPAGEADRGEPRPADTGAHEAAQRRPSGWLRRLLYGE